jgi:hypothetical protein
MEQIDNAPQRDWAELGWTTHRLPTRKDADPGRMSGCRGKSANRPETPPSTVNYQTIVPGQPWYSLAAQVDQPAPAESDQFAALDQRVAVVENTMRQLLHGSKFRLVVEPR